MKAFSKVSGKVIPLNWKDCDTDMIIPAQYLTSVESSGFGEHLFKRYRESDPDFILNHVSGGTHKILVAGSNFGCGSSREHAVWALQEFGIRVVIAPSFSDIFTNNAFKNGLLLVTCTDRQKKEILELIKKDPGLELTVDLFTQSMQTDNWTEFFDLNPFRKNCLLKGMDDLGYLLDKLPQISEHRKKHPVFLQQDMPKSGGKTDDL